MKTLIIFLIFLLTTFPVSAEGTNILTDPTLVTEDAIKMIITAYSGLILSCHTELSSSDVYTVSNNFAENIKRLRINTELGVDLHSAMIIFYEAQNEYQRPNFAYKFVFSKNEDPRRDGKVDSSSSDELQAHIKKVSRNQKNLNFKLVYNLKLKHTQSRDRLIEMGFRKLKHRIQLDHLRSRSFAKTAEGNYVRVDTVGYFPQTEEVELEA